SFVYDHSGHPEDYVCVVALSEALTTPPGDMARGLEYDPKFNRGQGYFHEDGELFGALIRVLVDPDGFAKGYVKLGEGGSHLMSAVERRPDGELRTRRFTLKFRGPEVDALDAIAQSAEPVDRRVTIESETENSLKVPLAGFTFNRAGRLL